MRIAATAAFVFVLLFSVGFCRAKEPERAYLTCRGAGDASAAAAITEDMFVVADDESNVLRIYRTDKAGLPVCSYDLTGFLSVEDEHPEADIEAATRVAERMYFITSHGRNKDGRIRESRYRFFAVTVDVNNGGVVVRPVGRPYEKLVHELLNSGKVDGLGLDEATQFGRDLSKQQREKLAPKKLGLNIEGLCASADGRILYIGFRNPRPTDLWTRRAGALVVPLMNAAGVVERAEPPVFGEPVLWDLRGLGIRSMEYSRCHRAFFVIAGPHDESSNFVLYRWSGRTKDQPVLLQRLSYEGQFKPEALLSFDNLGRVLLLSDDGSLVVEVAGPSECVQGEYRGDGTCLNKFLIDPNRKSFRAVWLRL